MNKKHRHILDATHFYNCLVYFKLILLFYETENCMQYTKHAHPMAIFWLNQSKCGWILLRPKYIAIPKSISFAQAKNSQNDSFANRNKAEQRNLSYDFVAFVLKLLERTRVYLINASDQSIKFFSFHMVRLFQSEFLFVLRNVCKLPMKRKRKKQMTFDKEFK